MKTLRIVGRLILYVRPYTGRLILLVALSLAGVIVMVSKPLPVKLIIDNVLLGKELPGFIRNFLADHSISFGTNELLYYSLALMAIIVIGGIIINYISFLLISHIGIKLVYDLSLDLYKKFQSLSINFYNKNKIGDLLQRFNGDVFAVYLLVAQIILPLVTSLLALAGMFYVMYIIDPLLALIAISVVPLLVILLLAVSKPMNRTTMDQYDKQGELSAFVQQSLVSMRVIQAFVRENYMLEKLMSKAMSFKKAYYKSMMISEGYNQATNLITGIASVVLVGIGAVKGIKGNISPGDLYVFLGYIAALYGPVTSLAMAAGAIIAFGSRGRRVYDILDADDEVPESAHAAELKNVRGSVEFINVNFGYNRSTAEEVFVLKGINFRAEPGKVTAIVGSTGAGKTSLISLLGRFHDPWSGMINIDDRNINEFKVKSLRENISMVLQDPILFPVSIAENIAFGNPDADLAQIKEAAKLSEAHDFIMSFPKGYDTLISEAGLSLSGGEKQRLSLARAFLTDTPVIVLDEPTSSVDAITEARIFERLKDHNLNKTVFIISHRLSTIKNAEQILVLENGVISEAGTHRELILNNKLCAQLYSQQTID
jgi:ATP-binding cassette, subfamily B, bacterial